MALVDLGNGYGVILDTKEKAVELIQTYCFRTQINHEQMRECEILQQICNLFSIDTDNIIIYKDPNTFECSEDFPNIYEVRY